MDIALTSTAFIAPKSPKPETETPTRIQPKFSNGILKRHNQVHHHHHAPPIVVIYKELLIGKLIPVTRGSRYVNPNPTYTGRVCRA